MIDRFGLSVWRSGMLGRGYFFQFGARPRVCPPHFLVWWIATQHEEPYEWRRVRGDVMSTQDDPPTKSAELPLAAFELPKWLVETAVRSCRIFNTTLDFIFYDVPTLRAALAQKDTPMEARGEKPPSRIIDFDALSDPEGSLLLIDATTAPYVHKYQSVKKFLESPYQETRDVDIATITGVGSSALGSAALAWDISVALERPVLAIVPGYGVADVVLQGLGGWFAFGLHDFLSSKTL